MLSSRLRKFLLSLTLVITFLTIFSAAAVPTFAACDPGQGGVNLSDCFKLNDTQAVKDVYKNPNVLVNLLVRNLFIVAGIIFFFLIVAAGYQLITGGTKGKDQAKTMIETAVIGFIVMFAAYWILQIIRIATGAEILI